MHNLHDTDTNLLNMVFLLPTLEVVGKLSLNIEELTGLVFLFQNSDIRSLFGFLVFPLRLCIAIFRIKRIGMFDRS